LIYFEEYKHVAEAFYREKQIQGWSRKKKEALMKGENELLPELAIAYRDKVIKDSKELSVLNL
jgi:putative endonuclease